VELDMLGAPITSLVCYCDDCQAFVHHLGRADLLDAHAGSDIVQVAPASLVFEGAISRIAGLRLSPKGLYRWYATCCRTPVGNTLSPSVPFVGVFRQLFGSAPADEIFGEPRGRLFGKFAVDGAPEGSTRLNPRMLAGAARLMLGWKLRGKTWPHPFFERSMRAPRYGVTTLSASEREALRPLCGPHPRTRAQP
jgi:hypothetical protein